MALGSKRSAWWLGGVALAALLTLPVVSQESLLPPGFDAPSGGRPAPAPSPSPAPRPGNATPAPSPSTPSPSPTPAPRPSPPVSGGVSGGSFAPAAPSRPVLLPDGTLVSPDDPLALNVPPPPPRYDLPPGSRRLLTRVGPLTPEMGGLPPEAFGNRGQYVTLLMAGVKQPVVSRWSFLLLRRAMLTAADTPTNVNGADFAAARAWLLLNQGEANGARLLVQSVDID